VRVPSAAFSVVAQRWCAKPNCDEACLAPLALLRSE